eukprot:365679-Chlamydomonas_euryale.AAC.16
MQHGTCKRWFNHDCDVVRRLSPVMAARLAFEASSRCNTGQDTPHATYTLTACTLQADARAP